MIIQPSARAVAAAAALRERQRAREASRNAEDFEWTGAVDFDITDSGPIPPPRRNWKMLALWLAAATAGLLIVAAGIWWGMS